MAIAFGAIGSKSAGGTSAVLVAYPATVGAGDLLVTGRALWNGGSLAPKSETGWNHAGDLQGGAGGIADSHLSAVSVDTKLAAGGETGSVAFDQTGSGSTQSCIGVMARYTKSSTSDWSVQAYLTGDDASHAPNRSVTASTNIDLAPGDVLVAVVSTDTDVSLTITSPTFTASGITFGTVNRRTSGAGVFTGNDGNIEIFDVPVSSGTGTVSTTFAFTTATNQCGPIAFIRLREISPRPQRVQQITAGTTSGTSVTLTLPAAPTAGNFLVATIGIDKNSDGGVAMSGWTMVHDSSSASVSLLTYYKTSDGTETSISPSWTTSTPSGVNAWYAEYAQTGSGPWTVVSAINPTDETAVSSCSSGTTAATSVDSTALAFFTVDSGVSGASSTSNQVTYSNGFSEHASSFLNSAGAAGLWVATYDVASGSTASCTRAYDAGTADKWTGAVIAFGRGVAASTFDLASTGTGTSTGSAALSLILKASSTGTGASTGSVSLRLSPGKLSATGTGQTTGSVNLLLAPAAISATGTGQTAGSAALLLAANVSATGTGQTAGSLDVTVGFFPQHVSATGTGQTGGSCVLSLVQSMGSAGAGTSTGSAALVATLVLSGTGTGTAAGALNLTPVTTHALAAIGLGTTAGSLALRCMVRVSASGSASSTGSLILNLQQVIGATGYDFSRGQVVLGEPMYRFSVPSHEEPIRVGRDRPHNPLRYYRLTYAPSLVNISGTWTTIRTPSAELLSGLVDGRDYFRGGYDYAVSQSVADSLAAAGYTSTPI